MTFIQNAVVRQNKLEAIYTQETRTRHLYEVSSGTSFVHRIECSSMPHKVNISCTKSWTKI